MAVISILIDPYVSHIFPTIRMATDLVASGHDVHYLGILDLKPYVEKYDFKYHIIFQEVCPEGYLDELKERQTAYSEDFQAEKFPRPHLLSIVKGELDAIVQTIQPDLMVVIYSLSLELFLLKTRYPKLNFLSFTTWLRPPQATPFFLARQCIKVLDVQIRKELMRAINLVPKVFLQNMKQALSDIPEVIACPAVLDFSNVSYSNKVFHLDISIAKYEGSSGFMEQLEIAKGKKLIYVSFGSQAALFVDRFERIVKVLIDLMNDERSSDWVVLLSLGKAMSKTSFINLPSNFLVVDWCPQMEVLQDTDLVITHGGLGTMKECISCDVPMIVAPMIYDQFDNAQRALHHGLGLVIDARTIDKDELFNTIETILSDHSYIENVHKMRQQLAIESNQSTSQLIEGFLAKK